MPSREEVQTAQIREAFKTHEVTTSTQGDILIYDWRRADNRGFHYMRFYLDQTMHMLFVMGDLGANMFRWGDRISIQWLATCGVGYFFEKRIAKDVGEDNWCSDTCEETALEWLKEHAEQKGDENLVEDYEERIYFAEEPFYNEANWAIFVNEYGYRFFGDGYDEFAYDAGKYLPYRAEATLIAIKMIAKQLKERDDGKSL